MLSVASFMSASAAESFKLSVNSEWPPYSIGTGKAADGILPKLVREIVEKRMGIEVAVFGSPWKRAQIFVKSGKLDALVTVPTEGRLGYTERSRNILYEFEMRATVKTGSEAHGRLASNPDVDTIRSLKVCDLVGNAWAGRFYKKHAIEFYRLPDAETCLRLIDRGRMDVMIQPMAVALHEIRKLDLGNRLTTLGKTFGGMRFALLVSKKSPFANAFIGKFDRTVDDMIRDGSLVRLIDRLRGQD